MSAPIGALLGRGAAGLPPAEPVDFTRLVLPPSPNTCLAAPPGGHAQAHITVPPLPVDAATAWPVLRRLGEGLPRTYPLAEWPERRQAQWVARSALMNYPDVIAAELVPGPGGAGLFLYSRSLFGWSDLGVNRRRVEAWLAAFEAALRRR
ncbi:DUF1499 domain-containing protein [Belnapia sp. T6]|uniref:DUF1499 domain-containing protein n=1 Tax=Belnapia mucosa TaxID=2804532 RepID=A0ABS1V080_9PROT|nr:DUF1499 domain-containing protein [Belnapia mucosa]MBL6455103.1 DUF1499 domain-containing protein [Belnapia mucosa]